MANGDVLIRMKADVSNYDANIAKARQQLNNFRKDNLTLGGVLKQTQSSLLSTAARFASVTAAVTALGSAFADNIATARKFEVSMSQLSSLTGMVGNDLNKLKEYAIELGSSTTLSASQVADAFKMIGSQQPQLLESGEALKAVTKNAITLAEAAGIDLATASQTLSTSINQMGGDSSNAERYINVLAAASQKGAGDIAWLGEAITKSGTTAKAVGTDYEELVANLEQLAKAGFDASTAGTALRSIIMNLEKQANSQFKPSVVGLTQAFENLGKANLDIVGYQELTGKMFASQAKALADAAGEAKNMTVAITGTNTAEEQAKTNTDNLEGSIKALSSAWEGFNLHLNSSNGIFRDVVDGLKDIVVWADKVITKLGEMPNPEDVLTKNMTELGPNVDDKGNYIKRPAQKGAVGFDWNSGTWRSGYTGAIYNGATGQTELPEVTVSGTRRTNSITGGTNKTGKINLPTMQDFNLQMTKNDLLIQDQKAAGELVRDMPSPYQMMFDEIKKQYLDNQDFDYGKDISKNWKLDRNGNLTDKPSKGRGEESIAKDITKFTGYAGKMLGGVEGILGGISQLGIELPQGLQDVLNGIQGIMSIASGIASILMIIQSLQEIQAAASAIPFFAHGGIVPHAAGGFMVPGNDHADRTPVLVSSGELILNHAQQTALANELQGNGMQNLRLRTEVSGRNLVVVIENDLKAQGKGQLATFK